MKNNYPKTLKDVSLFIQSGEGLQNTLGNFLDQFKRLPTPQAFAEIPVNLGKEMNTYLAAVADYLAEEIGTEAPSWSKNSLLVFDPPLYPTKNPDYQALLLYECPIAFRKRGIIVSKNALSRA